MSLFNYFTHEKNLNNLSWIYATDQGAPNPLMYYPSDDYVDIVALDVYLDNSVFYLKFLLEFIARI
jgi:beta-mannanase